MSERQSAENDVTQEYALRVDCERNGCAKPHGDDGFILPRGIESEAIERVNGHAVTFVVRDVIRSPWRDLTRDIPPAEKCLCSHVPSIPGAPDVSCPRCPIPPA